MMVNRRSTPSCRPLCLWEKPLSTWYSVRLPVPLPLVALVSDMNCPHRLIVSLFLFTLSWQAVHSAIFSPSSQISP